MSTAGYEPILYADTFDKGFDYYCRSAETGSRELAEFLDKNLGCERSVGNLILEPPAGVFAGFAMGSREQMAALETELGKSFPEQLYVHVLRSPRYAGYMCEVAPFGVSKWTGVMHLAAEWSIRPEQICAVGDDVNDIPMISGAGLGVAMENAVDAVKSVADRIAPSNDDDGLVEVVRWLLK